MKLKFKRNRASTVHVFIFFHIGYDLFSVFQHFLKKTISFAEDKSIQRNQKVIKKYLEIYQMI